MIQLTLMLSVLLPCDAKSVELDGISAWERTAVDPAGSVVLVSGFPPTESGDVLGLAVPLCEAGWNVILFQPPGSWSSSGTYSLSDINDVIGLVLNRASAPRALIGHSAGGLMLQTAMAQGVRATCLVSIAAPNVSEMAAAFQESSEFRTSWIQQFDRAIGADRPIRSGSGDLFSAELIEVSRGMRLGERAMVNALVIRAENDEVVPAPENPIDVALALDPTRSTIRMLNADHDFTNVRDELQEVVIDWLNKSCRMD